MIYVDTSVLLAELFSEIRRPPEELWQDHLIASRLLEYETWMRLHAYHRARSHGEQADALLARVAMLEPSPVVLARAKEPFQVPLRTLDAIHLSSAMYLATKGLPVTLATYDARLASAAGLHGVSLYPLPL